MVFEDEAGDCRFGIVELSDIYAHVGVGRGVRRLRSKERTVVTESLVNELVDVPLLAAIPVDLQVVGQGYVAVQRQALR